VGRLVVTDRGAHIVVRFEPLNANKATSAQTKPMPGPSFQIGYLANHEAFIPELARLHYAEWSSLRPGESLEGRTQRLRASCGHASIPTVIVAFSDAGLLGSAMLTAHDMDTRMELSPWLAGVFVVREHRGKGIGSALWNGS
jgi:hypothetical protein